MPSTTQRLTEKSIAHPPKWLPSNIQYETQMGSVAYGVSSDTSDMDLYGFAIPPKEMIFPHLSGEILGFGNQTKRFEQYQEHHLNDPDSLGGAGRVYDLSIYSIVKYFQLAMENNPNLVDSLFTPETCVTHITKVGTMVREARKLFLHKGSWFKFKGYSYSQLHKMASKEPIKDSKRAELREKFGFDVKYAYHLVRLLYEAEMILSEGDIDLMRHREHLKSIRRGEVSEADIREWASSKEKGLEKLYEDSKLRYSPDEPKIKELLLNCLEEHYGNLEKCVVNPDKAMVALRKIQEIAEGATK